MKNKVLLAVGLTLIGVGGVYYALRLSNSLGISSADKADPLPPSVAMPVSAVDTPNAKAGLPHFPAPMKPVQPSAQDSKDSLVQSWGSKMNELLARVNSRDTAKQYLQGSLDQLLERVSSDAISPMVFVADNTILPSGERFGSLRTTALERGRRLYATVENGSFHYYDFPVDSGLHLPAGVKSFLTGDDLEQFELQMNMIMMQNSAARKAARRAQK